MEPVLQPTSCSIEMFWGMCQTAEYCCYCLFWNLSRSRMWKEDGETQDMLHQPLGGLWNFFNPKVSHFVFLYSCKTSRKKSKHKLLTIGHPGSCSDSAPTQLGVCGSGAVSGGGQKGNRPPPEQKAVVLFLIYFW